MVSNAIWTDKDKIILKMGLYKYIVINKSNQYYSSNEVDTKINKRILRYVGQTNKNHTAFEERNPKYHSSETLRKI